MEYEPIGRETLSEILNAEYDDASNDGMEEMEEDLNAGLLNSLSMGDNPFSDPFGGSLYEEELEEMSEEDLLAEALFAGNPVSVPEDGFGRFLKNTEAQIDWMNDYLEALDNMESIYNEEVK